MALILYRIMRMRLKRAQTNYSPERALEMLRRIQRHRIRLGSDKPIEGISSITDEQSRVFQALGIKKPTSSQHRALL